MPGEIAGYWAARRRFGNSNISWQRILQPTIDMCSHGIPVTRTLAEDLAELGPHFTDPGLLEVFTNPETGHFWQEGDLYTNLALANTLQILADQGDLGDHMFYNGTIAEYLVAEITDQGNVEKGLLCFDGNSVQEGSSRRRTSARTRWSGWTPSPPASCPTPWTSSASLPQPADPSSPPSSTSWTPSLRWRRTQSSTSGWWRASSGHLQPGVVWAILLTERSRISFGWFGSLCSDSDLSVRNFVRNITSVGWAEDTRDLISDWQTYNDSDHYGANFYSPPDHGTAHISVLAPDGSAVAVTATVNFRFGAEILSRSTGILLNDEMDDFSYPDIINDYGLPPSPNNFVQPGKRPMSSMCPSLFTDRESGEARLVVGAAGGTKITTSVALTAVYNLMYGWGLEESVGQLVLKYTPECKKLLSEAPRLHHQLLPMTVSHQTGFSPEVLEELRLRGHATLDSGPAGSVVGAIGRTGDGRLVAVADSRKSGAVAGINSSQ